jgi:competence protein ComEA
MDPLVPQWRTLGTDHDTAAARSPDRPSRVARLSSVPPALIMGTILVVAGLLAVVAAGVLALAPEPRMLLVDAATDPRDMPGPLRPAGVPDAVGAGVVAAAAPLVIDVAGAVARPGIVHVPPGSRVGDAIRLAGGFGPRADLTATMTLLNLAAPLADGTKVLVPELGNESARPATGPSGSDQGGLVDLNHATQAELEELPGIGPVTAGKIIQARDEQPFGSVDELRGRDVLGPSAFDKVRELVTVGR